MNRRQAKKLLHRYWRGIMPAIGLEKTLGYEERDRLGWRWFCLKFRLPTVRQLAKARRKPIPFMEALPREMRAHFKRSP